MTNPPRPIIVIPGDDPAQLSGSRHLSRLEERGEVVLFQDRPTSDEEKMRRAANADILINSRGSVKWPAQLLEQLPQLRFLTVCGVGTDSIDLEAARQQGIVVSNVPGKTAPVVAEHALGIMMATAKRAAYQTAELKAGRWTQIHCVYLTGKTLGVIGTGTIGGHMIRLARAIGMDVVAWTFHPSPQREKELGVRFVDLADLLHLSDVVSLHVKYTPQSQHLLGERELALMKPGSLLVNTARAGVVDTEALVAALKSGHLGGAAVDVFDPEPPGPEHPLLDCEQVVLTPHSADQTPEGYDFLNAGVVDNVIAYLEGKPRNVVN